MSSGTARRLATSPTSQAASKHWTTSAAGSAGATRCKRTTGSGIFENFNQRGEQCYSKSRLARDCVAKTKIQQRCAESREGLSGLLERLLPFALCCECVHAG